MRAQELNLRQRQPRRHTIFCNWSWNLVVVMTVFVILVLSVKRATADDRASDRTEAEASRSMFRAAEPTPDPEFGDPNDPVPWTVDENPPPECPGWDGEEVYCDFIGGTMIVRGTADGERVWIERASFDPADEGYLRFTIEVTHSNGVKQFFDFGPVDVLASLGVFSVEDLPEDFEVTLDIEMRCGNDVVVNRTGADAFATLGAGDDFYFGSSGVDIVEGEWHQDVIFGGLGQDFINGGPGSDLLCGGWEAAGVITYPGAIDFNLLMHAPFEQTYDNQTDQVNCGQDTVTDWIIAEEVGIVPVVIDNLINLDFNSPPGTDVVNPVW